MKKTFILTLAAVALTSSLRAQFTLAVDDFGSYASGASLNGANWNPKWQSESDQQDLFTGSGSGTAILDTSTAIENYHTPSQVGFSLTGSDTATIQIDFNYTLGAGTFNTFNESFLALGITTSPNWWAGSQKYHSVVNRGNAIGTSLPVAPWVEQWIPQSSVGVTGVSVDAGVATIAADTTSNWLTLVTTVDVSGGFYRIKSDIYTIGGTLLSTGGTANATDIAEGTIIYSSMTTGFNGEVGTVQDVTGVKQVEVDNFSLVSTVPEPGTYALIAGMLALSSVMVRRRQS